MRGHIWHSLAINIAEINILVGFCIALVV